MLRSGTERKERHRGRGTAAALALLLVAGCAAPPETLMETPVLYERGAVSPFEHLAENKRTPCVDVLFATDRARLETRGNAGGADVSYGTRVGATTRLGHARVRFGEDLSWAELEAASLGRRAEDQVIALHLEDVRELGRLGPREHARAAPEEHGHEEFAARLDAQIAGSADPDVFVYVHGARVDFYRCVARSAEFAHFAGRDFATVVFDWPSHPQIFSYLTGTDVQRARRASASLAHLLELIAHDTRARRVHILAYSAGARVASHALSDLRSTYSDLSAEELRARLRIGTVVYAAGDLEVQHFLELAHDVHDVAERLCVLSSDADNVLRMAERFMGGGERLGELRPEELIELAMAGVSSLERLEVVDVSAGKSERGFDIGGHHYWYRHPWISSDLILNIRASLQPGQRGLVPLGTRGVWGLSGDYPDRAHEAALEAKEGNWTPGPRKAGIEPNSKADAASAGSASFVVVDPGGDPMPIDQLAPKPGN